MTKRDPRHFDGLSSEEELRISEEKFAAVFKHSPDAMSLSALETGLLLEVNEAFEEISGYTREQALGATTKDLGLWPDPAVRDRLVEELKANGSIRDFQAEFPNKLGGQRACLFSANVIKISGVPHMLAVARDITARKEAAEALQKEREFTEIALNAQLDTFFVFDPAAGKAIRWNLAFEQVSGYTHEEIAVLKAPDSYYSQDDLKKAAALVGSVVQNGNGRIELSLVCKDGHTVPTEYEVSMVPENMGNPMYIISIGRDITKRKQAEAALLDSEERFRSFSEASFEGIVVLDQGRILDVNDRMVSITGYTRQELCGMDVSYFLHPDDIDFARAHIRSGSDAPYETRALHKNGGIIHAQVCGKEIHFKGHPCRISAIQDVTEQRRTERALHDALQEIKTLNERVEAENVYLREEIRMSHPHGDIVGESKAINRVMVQAKQVAPTDSTVLIFGETGTGKELVARAIHDMSPRRDKSLVVVNCAAIPQGLVEGELFGREKGAYTGATTAQIGRFEAAHGGTLFLDEVVELPLETQAKLLRVLEDGEFQRLGSTKTVSVDVRVIVATNRDLEQAVEDGAFRRDLFFRLNVFPIAIPPLRERREDIEPLVRSFVNELGSSMGKKVEKISQASLDSLLQYAWPGNVRELRNVIERAIISMDGTALRVTAPEKSPRRASSTETLDEVQRNHILSTLDRTGWRVRGRQGAAAILGLAPSTLESRMTKLCIRRPGTSA